MAKNSKPDSRKPSQKAAQIEPDDKVKGAAANDSKKSADAGRKGAKR